MSQSDDGTASPLAPRMVIVASPTAAEAKRANHRALRNPRQGVRASSKRRCRSCGSSGDPPLAEVDRLDSADPATGLTNIAAMLVSLSRRCSSAVEQLIRNQ